jgi:exosortase A-associated hydrolase 2
VTAARPRVSGHFVQGKGGALALVLWQPPAGIDAVASVLHVPAFGDEMNKSRRMVALQARALAAQGMTVAALDLRGTGDSAGEFGDATWEGWCEDVRVAWDWLASVGPPRRALWGLRLGGLLCADALRAATLDPRALLLWQPVLSGRTFFRQLLRLPAAQRLADGTGQAARTLAGGPPALPSRDDAPVEVGGYALNPALVAAAEARSLESLPTGTCPVAWLEATVASPPALSPGGSKAIDGWRARGVQVDAVAVTGPSFWSSQEIAQAPELVAATTRCLHALLAGLHQGA